MRRAALLLAAALWTLGCGAKEEGAGKGPAPQGATAFQTIESDLLRPKCAAQAGCHMGASPAGGLDLEPGRAYQALVNVKAARRPERLRVVPGKPGESYLLERLTPGGGADTPPMPMGSPPLGDADLKRIQTWIEDGAKP